MNRIIHIVYLLAFAISLKAQVYNNEWINFNNQYYKFKIGQTGFYRIDSLALTNSGINLNSVNPKNFQLFIRGKEVPLYIQGESDNVLNATDFIEFFSEKNDGRFDSAIYKNISYIPNPYISLFNDTLCGYLTWNNSTSNKRILPDTDTTYSSYTPAPYVYVEKVFTQKHVYNYVEEYAYSTSDPYYTQAEGWGREVPNSGSWSTNMPSVNMYSLAALPVDIRINFSGSSIDNSVASAYDHEIKSVIYDGTGNPVTLLDTLFKGYKAFTYTFSVSSNTLGNTSNIDVFSLASAPLNGANALTNVHYIYYKYPSTPDMGNVSLQKLLVDDDGSQAKTYLKLNNVNTGTLNAVVFYDLTNKKRITSTYIGPYYNILVPNSSARKVCYIGAETGVMKVSRLVPVNQTGYFVNHKAVPADSAFVIIYHNKFSNEVNTYAAYRQTTSGGGHNVKLADIDEITDQFAWGIRLHPLSVRNYLHFLMDSMPSKPKFVFMVGKSVQHRNLIENGSSAWSLPLLPSIGIPPSDILLTAALTTTNNWTPEIPVGRLAAQTPSDVTSYYNKVVQHETTLNCHGPTDDWRKHVLHFAGGTDLSQQSQFQGYLNNYKGIIQDTSFGGIVYEFKKTTTAPIQITVSDSVKGHFNYGTSLVCFFGHGSFTGFDQAIDDPNAYSNAGKYPFFIANSCFSGNIHTYDVISSSEKFVLADQKGSIAFLAASSVGFVNTLNDYTYNIYTGLSHTLYNKSIGEIVKNACSVLSVYPVLDQFTAADMTLHGDPSIKISNGMLPDYFINNSSVSFDTKTYVDSLGIDVYINNMGRAEKDSMIVRVERYFPNGDSVNIYKQIKGPYYRDTLHFYTVVDYTRGFGLNKFKVTVDAYNGITESCETNNSTNGTVDVFIQGGDLVPVYPYKYAVVPTTPTITLKASTSDPFSLSRNYVMQLDTTDAFTSPISSTLITSTGGVVEWTVNLPLADSTVYYWRVSKDSTSALDTYVWRESSFQCITDKHGWGQSHFFQFKNDGYQFVKFKRPLRQFVFENDKRSLFCRTGRIYTTDPLDIIYSINGAVQRNWCCTMDGWDIAVFDSISGQPWISNSAVTTQTAFTTYGNCVCEPYVQALPSFEFGGGASACPSTASFWQSSLTAFINSIPPNNYILAYSIQDYKPSTYNNALYSAFESFGSANIRTVADTVPYIIYGRKGAAIGQAHEVIATYSTQTIVLNDTITTRWNNGYIASELIGPGYKWNSFHWKVQSLDAGAGDTTIVKIVGIKSNGQRDTLVTFTQDSLNVLDLYNYADANTYYYLQLVAFKKDNVFRTSPQLKWWYVLYDEAPECAINPKKGFKAINDTLQEGDKVTFILPIDNVGKIPFNDSLVCTYWIEDASRNLHYLPQRLKPFPFNPGSVILDTIKVDTYLYPGNNALWVDINPPQNPRYQREQYHFNNIARYAFSVNRDITNPLLDVTFDGIRIMNGDVVSAKPHILINLKDENKFLALNDTSDFTVYLKKPSDPAEKRIPFANGLQFTPAQLPGNSCKIEYDARLAEDGKYVLIVQAKDRSENQSGAVDYRITFEVVNKPTITEVVNYPNPFSTSTRFVFNLTGSDVPDVFNIQIMTITGKIVKTIMRDELGPLHVGRNITEYAWDGKDDFGDKLANGVYLYKVQTKLNGQNIEHKSTEADSYFTKELGKMVIMR